MALDALYHYKPVAERYSSASGDDDDLFDLPRNVSVSLAFLLSFVARYRHNDAAAMAALQERLIMPVTERIISEIRAMRDGNNTTVVDRAALPYDVSATSLRDLRNDLAQIRQSILDSRADSDDVESLLLQIITALG